MILLLSPLLSLVKPVRSSQLNKTRRKLFDVTARRLWPRSGPEVKNLMIAFAHSTKICTPEKITVFLAIAKHRVQGTQHVDFFFFSRLNPLIFIFIFSSYQTPRATTQTIRLSRNDSIQTIGLGKATSARVNHAHDQSNQSSL